MWSPLKMDETSEKMDKAIARGRSGRALHAANDSIAQHSRPAVVKPAETVAARLCLVAVDSHFEAREWRLGVGAWSGYDHSLLLQSGQAWLHGPGEPMHIIGPAFVWSPARSADRLVIEAGGSGHVLQIRRDLMEQTFRQIPEASELINLLAAEQPLVLAIAARSAVQFSRTMSLISVELEDIGPGAEAVLSAALVISFVQLWRHVGARALARGETGSVAALLMRFRQLVEERFREQWRVEHYAEALGVTPGRLHAISTRTLGRAPRILIQQRLLYEAVVRLERSAITIKQLSYMLGFKDAAYFNRFFAKHVGLPPARYRRECVRRDVAGRAPQMPFTFSDWP
jgi:AraC family transcriptional regulator, transcriptional activator of pobA